MAVHKIDGVDGVVNYPKKFVTLWSDGAAILKGDCVQISTSTTYGIGLTVTQCDVADGGYAIGIAMEAAGTTAIPIKVQVAGYNDICVGVAAISQFDLVGADTGTDGRLRAVGGTGGTPLAHMTSATGRFAICVTAATTTPLVNFTDLAIMIYDHGFYG